MTTSEPLVVDASIGAKWIFDEEESHLARALSSDSVHRQNAILVPPHFLTEVFNATWRKVARGAVSVADGREAVSDLSEFRTTTVSPPFLAERAYELALQLAVRPGAIYDLLYVALAQIVGCVLWTADAKLAAAVEVLPVEVRLLSTYEPRNT